VLEAADGLEALEILQQQRPTLVISDVLMPRLDGQEMVRRIRSDPDLASIPVMLLTAKAGPETRLEGLERGADDYLAKPFEPRELMARARNLIRLQEQEDNLKELNARLKQEAVRQASVLANARMLGRYMPSEIVRSILDEGQPVQVKQQRYRITVFRIELRGFVDVLERLEPEEMAAMLNGYLSEMTDVAFGHGATVDTFIRDTVIGFFGAPTSQGPQRDAIRCARMAVEMLQRAFDVCSRWSGVYDGQPPTPTIVIASGYATVGNFGSSSRLEYTAVGGPVDEVAAVMSTVGPGEVTCTQSSWVLVKDEMDGQACGEVTLRSSTRPVQLHRIFSIGQMASAQQETQPLPLGLGADTMPREPRGPVETDAHPSDTLEPGAVLADRYEIVRRLGEGAMGSVYRVLDLKLNSDVALKLIRPRLKASPRQLARFYREVKMARLVSHPNVARIYDLGEWEGHEFISMEYIPGQTLAGRLRTSGPLSLEEGQRILYQLCAGLAAAHTVGIVHCDLKPANIMIEEEGRAVILDFGIARWGSELHQTDPHSQRVIGTPLYMAPEQFEGSGMTSSVDIYSLGVVIYEMFIGRPPFIAESVLRVAYKHTHEPPPDALEHRPDLPSLLSAVIQRCMAKAPQDRFTTVGEITSLLVGSMPDLARTLES
jgi:CheY-like chemotaxis protein